MKNLTDKADKTEEGKEVSGSTRLKTNGDGWSAVMAAGIVGWMWVHVLRA